MSDNENTNENPNSTSDNEGKEETGVVVSKIDNPKKGGFTMEEILARRDEKEKKRKVNQKNIMLCKRVNRKFGRLERNFHTLKLRMARASFVIIMIAKRLISISKIY